MHACMSEVNSVKNEELEDKDYCIQGCVLVAIHSEKHPILHWSTNVY